MNRFQNMYYTREIPARSVAIAKVKSAVHKPADLTDVLDIPYLAGTFEVRDRMGALKATAKGVGEAIAFSGDTMYWIGTQFFELTDRADVQGNPLFYRHELPAGALNVVIRDGDDRVIEDGYELQDGSLYHSLRDGIFWVNYVDTDNRLRRELLKFRPVMQRTEYSAGQGTYIFNSLMLQVATDSAYWIRFTSTTGYRVLAPYEAMPNVPWFARLRFTPGALPQEYAKQVFLPKRPYMLGTWVPGTVVDKNVLQLSRPEMLDDPEHRPDILVFDRDNAIKYALEGTLPGTQKRRGTMYPWRRGQIQDVDAYTSRVQVAVELSPDDIVFGFYSYREPDVVYTALDVNPYTNPLVRNRFVNFYFKNDGVDRFSTLYHEVTDEQGTVFQTNDTAPGTGTRHDFGTLCVGATVGTGSFEVSDERVRGGGLLPKYQDDPRAMSFWDIGHWDGKPYPLAGVLAVYLPKSILDRMSADEVKAKVERVMPLGTLPLIRYIDDNGQEWI